MPEHHRWRRHIVIAASLTTVLSVAACGSGSDAPEPAAPSASGAPATSAASVTPAAPAASPASAPPADASGCPISVDALGTVTSLRWELGQRQENRPLETSASIRATVCVFTAAGLTQLGGDPLVFRTDMVTGRDAATVRADFRTTCGSLGGAVKSAGGGSVCERGGAVVEGMKGEGDRVVLAEFVNADNATAARLTPAFTKVLDAVR